MDYVIFEIDDDNELAAVSRATRVMDSEFMFGRLNMRPVICQGGWEGAVSQAYLMRLDDYEGSSALQRLTRKQDAITVVKLSGGMLCTAHHDKPRVVEDGFELRFAAGRRMCGDLLITPYGMIPESAMESDGWTYVPPCAIAGVGVFLFGEVK